MNLYFAPLEGITTRLYRNAHFEYFGSSDRYFAPFITPGEEDKMTKKLFKSVLKENNANLCVQILTNNSKTFLNFEKKLMELGYDDVNINLGCPSGTVVKKGRGSGFLLDPENLNRFLYEIFEKTNLKISLKTRIGFNSSDEMENLMEIFNKYPLSLLIIHPRTRQQFYKGEPDLDVFERAYNISKNKVCYNGDIFSKSDYETIVKRFPDIDSVMIGRGAIVNPAIFREINGGMPINKEEILKFSETLCNIYLDKLCSKVYTLHKLKEIWTYMILNFPEEKKAAKGMKKAATLDDFKNAVKLLY